MANIHNGRPIPNFNSEKYIWLRNHLELDLLNIDDELVKISVLVQEASENTALAIEIRESAKEDLERVSAELSAYLRLPDDKGKVKSETQISSLIPMEEGYKQALLSLSEARLDAGLWMGITDAFRTKSSAIRVTTDLIVAGYLTSNSIVDKRHREMRHVK